MGEGKAFMATSESSQDGDVDFYVMFSGRGYREGMAGEDEEARISDNNSVQLQFLGDQELDLNQNRRRTSKKDQELSRQVRKWRAQSLPPIKP
ncbi:hypothetical protein OIU84_005785 [Salix udensis]|uniref:Uncharacterized protein n=1 Tax=Salix udensis TaxID=889485 RepID=A0AAD6JZ55_9ROSI|nr:hypothetical protein OIU84_005785 [Salix udensis]